MAQVEHLAFSVPAAPVLLHCCCAPCSGSIIERLKNSEVPFAVFFYNPNIDPPEEYLKRKACLQQYVSARQIRYFDGDYDHAAWLEAVKGYEQEPERGKRCGICFYFRLLRTAALAEAEGFKAISTTLGISRWKSFEQVTASGLEAVRVFKDLVYWDYPWRKNNGEQRASAIAKSAGFYRQRYCGCEFSCKQR